MKNIMRGKICKNFEVKAHKVLLQFYGLVGIIKKKGMQHD